MGTIYPSYSNSIWGIRGYLFKHSESCYLVLGRDPPLAHFVLFGDAFVDDSFIGTIPSRPQALNHPSHTTTKELALKALGNLAILAQQWEHLLFTTGGEICLSKSFWYLLSWKWTKAGTARPNSSSASPASLQLTSGYDTNKINVPRVEPTSTYRYWVRVSLLLEPLPAQ